MVPILRLKLMTACLLLGALTPSGHPAPASDFADLLRAVFEEHAQRAPTGAEIQQFSQVFRDQGSLEGYVQILGSDDYFVNQAHRDYNTYVSRLYQTFVGRDPRRDEQQFWRTQFVGTSGPRVDMVRQFCRANGVTQLPNGWPQQPSYRPPRTSREIAAELVSEVNLLINLVSRDLGGSRYGRRVNNRARSLLTVAEQFRQTVNSPRQTTSRLQIAADNLERSRQDLEREFYRVPGAMPEAQDSLFRIGQLIAAARNAVLGGGPLPSFPSPGFPTPGIPAAPGVPTQPPTTRPPRGEDIQRLEKARRKIRDFATGMRSWQSQSPYYASLSRDAQGLLSQMEALIRLQNRGTQDWEFQQAAQAVLTQTAYIGQGIAQADFMIQRNWHEFEALLQTWARGVGVGTGGFFSSSHPVVIHQPAWAGLPSQPYVSQNPSRNRTVISQCDELIGQIDDYVASLRPLESRNNQVRSMIAGLQDMRHATLVLRQAASSGDFGSSLSAQADRLMNSYQITANDFAAMVASDASLNSPLFMQIGESVQRLRYSARGQLR